MGTKLYSLAAQILYGERPPMACTTPLGNRLLLFSSRHRMRTDTFSTYQEAPGNGSVRSIDNGKCPVQLRQFICYRIYATNTPRY